jgi:hypothetical protein
MSSNQYPGADYYNTDMLVSGHPTISGSTTARQLEWTTATSAPVRDEALEAVLGMNQKHILFPCPGIFQPSSLPQNLPLIPLSYPLPTSLTSFPAHSIAKAWESSWAWVEQSFEETRDKRLEEIGKLNVEGMWKGQSKKSTSSQT